MKINYLLKRISLLVLFILPTLVYAQLGVNATGAAPSTDAMLDVSSTTKGVLIPRVSADLASPTEGLLYYNTTGHNFRYYDGTAWQNALFGNQWNINGSSISYSLGNVGIGTTTPATQFTIYKSDGANMLFQNLTTGSGPGDGLYIGNLSTSNGKAYIWNHENAALGFSTNGLERMTISATGNVGIGTTSPTTDLYVNGNGYFATTLEVGTNFYVYGNVTTSGNQSINGTLGVNGTLNANSNLAVDGNTTTNNGKGIVRSDDTSQMVIRDAVTPANLNITLSPGELSGDFTFVFGETFASPPAIAWGRTTGITNPGNVILTIDSIGTTSAQVRFKNVGSTNSVAANASVSAMIIGKK
ncbi:MAG: hypothetical protein V4683_05095 [Bacteroidota bacterium]